MGRSRVSAITQTPASGPLALVTAPRMLLPAPVTGATLIAYPAPSTTAAPSAAAYRVMMVFTLPLLVSFLSLAALTTS